MNAPLAAPCSPLSCAPLWRQVPAWRVMLTAALALAWGSAQTATVQPKPELSTMAERMGEHIATLTLARAVGDL